MLRAVARQIDGGYSAIFNDLTVTFGNQLAFQNSGGVGTPPEMSNETGQILCTGEIRMRGTADGQALFGVNQTATFRAFATDAPGDTSNRFHIDGNGGHAWGPGNAALDCSFGRFGIRRLGMEGSGIDLFTLNDSQTTGYSGLKFANTSGTQTYSIGMGGPGEVGIGVANQCFIYDGLAGAVRFRIATSGATTVVGGVSIPASGSVAAFLQMGATAGFGVYFGSGAPTVSAAQGSLYLRSDGSSTSTRLYVNTNGGTTWTNVTTAA